MHELVTALRLAGPDVRAALVERFRTQITTTVAQYAKLPEESIAKILADGDFDAAGYLAEGGPLERDLKLRAARLGDPKTATALIPGRDAISDDVLRELRTHIADPDDPAWHVDYGLVHKLRVSAGGDPLAVAAWPFPKLVFDVASEHCKNLPYAVAIDLCVAVADRGDREMLRRLALRDLVHVGLNDLVMAAADAPSPSAYLADLRPPEEWIDAAAVRAIAGVRRHDGKPPQDAELPPLDWDLVRREHERRPFDRESLPWLTRWPDCPDDIVAAALSANLVNTTQCAARLPFDIVENDKLADWSQHFREVVSRGVTAGWLPLDRLLTEAAPAGRIAGALPFDVDEVGTALAKALAPLGTDPVNWLTFYSRLPRFEGTIAALVDDVASGAGKRATKFPRPLPAAMPATPPENTRETFVAVLSAMPDAVTVALAPYLDARSVQHILVYREPSDAVRDALVAAHGSVALAAFAAHGGLERGRVEWLMAHDDAATDASLFAHAPLTDADRVRMLAGFRTDGSRGPVPQELLDVLNDVNLGHYRDRVTAGLTSGDLGVARVIAGRLRLATEGGRMRLLVAVWERNGPEGVREILAMDRLPATTVKAVEAALAQPDGIDRLRARMAADDAPEEFLKRLRKKSGYAFERLRKLVGEGRDVPWDAAVAAADADTLDRDVVDALVDRSELPPEFAYAALRWGARNGDLRSADWRERLLFRGLTPEDLLRHAPQPARYLTAVAFDRRRHNARRRQWAEPCETARALVDEHLGTNPDAWTVALHLLPDFTGTLPELLATARAAAG